MTRIRLLLLVADTGGGHRAAAQALAHALEERYPGSFDPVFCDPLGGPAASWLLRRVSGLYGPSIRLAPWIWGVVYYGSNSRFAMRLLRWTVLARVDRPIAEAVRHDRPAAIVSLHPLTGPAAVAAREHAWQPGTPVITLVTDLFTTHAAWRNGRVDHVVVPSAAAHTRFTRDGMSSDRCTEIGLPVDSSFRGGPLTAWERATLRRSLGLGSRQFVVVLTGGGEGSGGIARRVAALLRRFDDIEVIALCGRNERLKRKLDAVAACTTGNRLVVRGFVDNMADWLRCADVVVTKAGPGTIAEATCCGVPQVIVSHVPGQEKGNTEFVVSGGAGRRARTVRRLCAVIHELRRDPAAVAAMRAASARLGRPDAAHQVAGLLADLVGVPPPQLSRDAAAAMNMTETVLPLRAGGGHGPR
jgi:1,2-diacylglycerol 3-beta-galactosyltransferase